jgi:predicted transcriptional regulator
VSAYLSCNRVPIADLPGLVASIHAAISGLAESAAAAEPKVEKLSATKVRRSIKPDGLISLIDGKPYKTLGRHLTKHGMTIEDYCKCFGLPQDYPTSAASYSAQRSEPARSAGPGKRRKAMGPRLTLVAANDAEEPRRESPKQVSR